jgi:hypothetical protein
MRQLLSNLGQLLGSHTSLLDNLRSILPPNQRVWYDTALKRSIDVANNSSGESQTKATNASERIHPSPTPAVVITSFKPIRIPSNSRHAEPQSPSGTSSPTSAALQRTSTSSPRLLDLDGSPLSTEKRKKLHPNLVGRQSVRIETGPALPVRALPCSQKTTLSQSIIEITDSYEDDELDISVHHETTKDIQPRNCGICEKPVRRGLVSKCGHEYCASCWTTRLVAFDTCPECETPVSVSELRRRLY